MPFLHAYQQVIFWVEHHSPGPDKFDHTYIGLAIWLAAAAFFRANLRSLTPLLVLAGMEGINEVIDRLTVGRWVWPDVTGDVAATFFWPVTICILLRLRKIRP
jgi:hypothetical protein